MADQPLTVSVFKKLLEEILEQKFGEKLSPIYQRFDTVDERFDVIDQRFDVMDKKFDDIYQRFDVIDQRFDVIDQRFDVIDQRFDVIDQRFDQLYQKVDSNFSLESSAGHIRTKALVNLITSNKDEVEKHITEKIDRLINSEITSIKNTLDSHRKRLFSLERSSN